MKTRHRRRTVARPNRRVPERAGRVTVSIPADLLREVEVLRDRIGEDRSAVVRRALELLLRKIDANEHVREYVEAYRAQPESPAEAADAAATSGASFHASPWDPEPKRRR